MEPTAASFIPLGTASINILPYLIAGIVLAVLLYFPAMFLAGKENEARERHAYATSNRNAHTLSTVQKRLYAVAGAILAAAAVVGLTFSVIHSGDPKLNSDAEKIVANIEAKYAVSSVSLDDPHGDLNEFWVDKVTGNAVTVAKVTRVVDGQIIEVKYDAVINQKTGEPVLTTPAAATTSADPKTFLR